MTPVAERSCLKPELGEKITSPAQLGNQWAPVREPLVSILSPYHDGEKLFRLIARPVMAHTSDKPTIFNSGQSFEKFF